MFKSHFFHVCKDEGNVGATPGISVPANSKGRDGKLSWKLLVRKYCWCTQTCILEAVSSKKTFNKVVTHRKFTGVSSYALVRCFLSLFLLLPGSQHGYYLSSFHPALMLYSNKFSALCGAKRRPVRVSKNHKLTPEKHLSDFGRTQPTINYDFDIAFNNFFEIEINFLYREFCSKWEQWDPQSPR